MCMTMELQLKQQSHKKNAQFLVMIHTFEEIYEKKLEPSQVVLWRKFLLNDADYPESYFIRVVELAGELKWFPRLSEVKERFYEYSLQDTNRRVKLPPPRNRKEVGDRWMAQNRIILSYGGKLKHDFDWRLMGKLYEPEKLKELLENNLKERS